MATTAGRAVTPDDIRGILAAHKLAQTMLADTLRVHWTTVAYWLSGRRHPNAAHSAALTSMIESDR